MPLPLTRPLARRLTPRPARALLTLAFLLLAFAGLAAAPAGAQQLVATFTTQPPTSVASQTAFTVVVHVTDGTNPVTGAAVALTLASGTGTLFGTTSGTTGNNGDVTLAPSVNLAGTKQLTATASQTGFTSGSVVSSPFTVTPGPVSQLVFTQPPTNAPVGLVLNSATNPQGVIVQAQDAAGNAVVSQTITVTAGTGSGGTLTGTTTQTSDPNAGLAVFRDLRFTAPGTDALLATDGGVSSSSSTFTITADPAPVVTTTADDGSPSTLRSILGFVAPGTTVTFDPSAFPANSTQTITLTAGQIVLSQDVIVLGPASSVDPRITVVTVSGNNASRVFAVTGGAVSFSNLGITNGLAPSSEGAPLNGYGGGVGVGGGSLSLTNCVINSNRDPNSNGQGGGVYNNGVLTMTDCTVSSNSANQGGGGVYNDTGASATLVGGVFSGNTTPGTGGGVYTDGTGVVTSCSFSGNSAGTGGGVYNDVDGSAVLTDDILYGDAGGEAYNNGGLASATFCDIQGSFGSAAQPDGNHNFSANPQFENTSDLRLTPFGPNGLVGSPVLGKGTTNAPGFRATDRNGNAYFSVPALGALETLDEFTGTRVLWTNPDGRTILWNLNAAGAFHIAGDYDPQSDGTAQYTAVSLAGAFTNFNAAGFVGPAYVLWNAPDGRAMLWGVADATGAVSKFTYGPFSDDGTSATLWQATAVSANDSFGGNGTVHILWTNPNGRTILWDVNPADGSFTVRGNYNGFSDDGTAQTAWKAFALATGPDNLSHVLWSNPDHHTLLWNLDSSDDQPVASPPQGNTSTAFNYSVFEDDGTANTIWSARALSVGPDNVPHILWDNPDGRTILWNVNADGSYTIPANYAPQPGATSPYAAVSLATGTDGRSHLAWDNADGSTFFWNVNPDGTHADVFFTPFLDDGTTATAWKAIAISAAELGFL